MKISVKTLSGELFQVEVNLEHKVGDIKRKIQDLKPALLIERQKLIHSGKVLKDEQSVSELGLAEADFIVCMITKEIAKKATAPEKPSSELSSVSTPNAQAVSNATSDLTPKKSNEFVSSAADPVPLAVVTEINQEALQALVNMGFPQDDSSAALAAASGNPDLAYEFLLTGIPDNLPSRTSVDARTSSVSIEQLRNHPQFNTLKRVVQQNPASLSQVLDLIGQQNPSLLAAIHSNNDAFLAMMNEPITEQSIPPQQSSNSGTDAAQMIQFLTTLPAEQRSLFAQSMGMTPDQLQGFINMMSSVPSSDLNSLLRGREERDNDPPGVIRLTHEEMASVHRLMALGFSQQQAAQAYLACDKNEALAANLLLEGGWAEDENDYGEDMHEDSFH